VCQAAVRGFFFKAVGARSGTHQGCADGVHDRHACVDVGDELALALARVRALAQEHDLGLLLNRRGGREDGDGGQLMILEGGKGRDTSFARDGKRGGGGYRAVWGGAKV
jgi:hypothetical protein